MDVTVARGNGSISTTGSKANVTGDEGPQLHAATVYAPTLPYQSGFFPTLRVVTLVIETKVSESNEDTFWYINAVWPSNAN